MHMYAHAHAHVHVWQSHAVPLHILSRRAHGGPSPADLTAYMAHLPRQPSHPSTPDPAPFDALIYASAERAKPTFFMLVLSALACQTRVGDRHARIAGCGVSGRQSP
eukprot:scaffold22401_cov77-Phaeocystis_antarctica.AAC.1